jgi:hypothetical protein
MQKEKLQENYKSQKGNKKNQILITCSPATALEKGAC